MTQEHRPMFCRECDEAPDPAWKRTKTWKRTGRCRECADPKQRIFDHAAEVPMHRLHQVSQAFHSPMLDDRTVQEMWDDDPLDA